MSYKVIHLRDGCIGCGACAAVCPDYWKMDNDGKSTLKGSKKNKQGNYEVVFEKNLECNEKAKNSCPVDVIKINK